MWINSLFGVGSVIVLVSCAHCLASSMSFWCWHVQCTLSFCIFGYCRNDMVMSDGLVPGYAFIIYSMKCLIVFNTV
jgi:hypothetical protein